MARFYASIQGGKGESTRMGSKTSGISGHIRGWQVGAKIEIWYDEKTKLDVVRIYRTSGSSEFGVSDKLITEFTESG